MRYFFACLDENRKLFGNFEKIFLKDVLWKLRKIHYFSIFFKNLRNHALIFCSFRRKTQIVGKVWESFEKFWWKFYRKIDFFLFLFILENLLIKIEPSEITPSIYNNFFVFWGGAGIFPSNGYAPDYIWPYWDLRGGVGVDTTWRLSREWEGLGGWWINPCIWLPNKNFT